MCLQRFKLFKWYIRRYSRYVLPTFNIHEISQISQQILGGFFEDSSRILRARLSWREGPLFLARSWQYLRGRPGGRCRLSVSVSVCQSITWLATHDLWRHATYSSIAILNYRSNQTNNRLKLNNQHLYPQSIFFPFKTANFRIFSSYANWLNILTIDY